MKAVVQGQSIEFYITEDFSSNVLEDDKNKKKSFKFSLFLFSFHSLKSKVCQPIDTLSLDFRKIGFSLFFEGGTERYITSFPIHLGAFW